MASRGVILMVQILSKVFFDGVLPNVRLVRTLKSDPLQIKLLFTLQI